MEKISYSLKDYKLVIKNNTIYIIPLTKILTPTEPEPFIHVVTNLKDFKSYNYEQAKLVDDVYFDGKNYGQSFWKSYYERIIGKPAQACSGKQVISALCRKSIAERKPLLMSLQLRNNELVKIEL